MKEVSGNGKDFTVGWSLNYTSFTAPGAVSGRGEFGTSPTGTNDSGMVTGFYEDVSLVSHGFVRF